MNKITIQRHDNQRPEDTLRNLYTLEVQSENLNQIVIRFYKDSDTMINTYRQKISHNELNKASKKAIDTLDLLFRGFSSINDLAKKGQYLYNLIFPEEIKERMAENFGNHLRLRIDESLVQIPWELIHDKQNFFSLKFHMGRMVISEQKIPRYSDDTFLSVSKILIISDPQGNLPKSHEEGEKLKKVLEKICRENSKKSDVIIDVLNDKVTKDKLIEIINDYDLIHYTGHADYNLEEPSLSGWCLSNGKLKAKEIKRMLGFSKPFIVFSNACQSAYSGEWKSNNKSEKNVFGLANAFLCAGVKHYIGTLWKISDEESSINLAKNFYENLFKGKTIGKAMSYAKEEANNNMKSIWCYYTLYGDPIYIYSKETSSFKSKITYELVLKATVDEISIKGIEGIITHLKKLSGDNELSLLKIEPGSVRIYLEGTLEGFEKINSLINIGQLIDILGFKIENLKIVTESDTQFFSDEIIIKKKKEEFLEELSFLMYHTNQQSIFYLELPHNLIEGIELSLDNKRTLFNKMLLEDNIVEIYSTDTYKFKSMGLLYKYIAKKLLKEIKNQNPEPFKTKEYINPIHQKLSKMILEDKEKETIIKSLEKWIKEEKNDIVRNFAVFELGMIKSSSSVPIIIEAANNDKGIHVQYYSIMALGMIKDKKALPTLIKLFKKTKEENIKRLITITISYIENKMPYPY